MNIFKVWIRNDNLLTWLQENSAYAAGQVT